MPRKCRKEEILGAIREYLTGAVKGREPITDDRLMKAAKCARATFYKYVTEGSRIEQEIEVARREQKKHTEAGSGNGEIRNEMGLRKKLMEAEEGNRKLLALIAQMTANLIIKYGVPAHVVEAAQRGMPHPRRSHSHAGRGKRRK